jgi:predicted transcriptional regulator
MSDIIKNEKPTVQELMKKTGRSKATIYNIAKKLGRLPTVEEILNQPPVGRPRKY